MDVKCEDCVYCDKSRIYHNIFDSDIWYGCNYGWTSNHTEDVFLPNGDLKFCWSNGGKYLCYKEKLQYSIDFDNLQNKKED